MGIRVLGTGSYLPEKVVTNDDIAKSLDTNDEWIYSHTGIHSRHVAGPEETTATMGAEAARRALAMAGVDPLEVGLIVLATTTPDYNVFPSTACVVQDLLGCKNAGAFDLSAACSGFVYALEQARGFVNFYPDKKAIVIGSETLTRIVDWSDRSSCILFGDGAGAVVLGNDEAPGVASTKTTAHTILGADGSGKDFITRSGGTREALPINPETGVPMPAKPIEPKMNLMGHDVFAFAVRALSRVASQLCERMETTPAEIDRVFA
ncbi:MAG: beta-ketoacyl-ACP synthase 3, partial [Kiritimatiellae bacterium]|nr:beta-ketoacyl-ACP synthase 3 [Kiritimatiellia bacterium]